MSLRFNQSFLFLCLALLGLGLSSCNSSSGDQVVYTQKQKEDGAMTMLNQKTGDSYHVVRSDSNVAGYSVFQDEQTGEYLAINMDQFSPGMAYDNFVRQGYPAMMTVVRNLVLVDQSHYEWDSTANYNPVTQQYEGAEVWKSEIVYAGHGYEFSDAPVHQKDLETLGAAMNAGQVALARNELVQKFGLSESRANELANLVSAWNSVSRKREMTAADLKDFSVAALGTDLSSLQKAYEKSARQGDSRDLDNLLKIAARTNGISVEHARVILGGLLN